MFLQTLDVDNVSTFENPCSFHYSLFTLQAKKIEEYERKKKRREEEKLLKEKKKRVREAQKAREEAAKRQSEEGKNGGNHRSGKFCF